MASHEVIPFPGCGKPEFLEEIRIYTVFRFMDCQYDPKTGQLRRVNEKAELRK